ncbi:hypothetical protein DBR42_23150 [Pelomonas sp. HMWF004]|nr:hypothetical protein DBR42_23150 [Pelomonas sp. HMWF004]
MDRKARLLQQIHEAFRDVQLGDGVTLHETVAIDDGLPSQERQSARRLDTAVRWQDVPDDHIARHSAAFSFLDTRGHIFYAPAYMCWLLRTGDNTESNSVSSARLAFDPWGKVEGGKRLKPHDMYSLAQCRAIAQYLLYVYEVLDEEGMSQVKQPLDTYWSQYL